MAINENQTNEIMQKGHIVNRFQMQCKTETVKET